MKLITAIIAAVLCAGLASTDLASAKSRNSGRGPQPSGDDQSYNDSSKPGHSAGGKSARRATGKSHSAAKQATRSKAKSRASSRVKRSAGSKPGRPDAGQGDVSAATQATGAGSAATPGVDRGNQGRIVAGRKARSDFPKTPSCASAGKSGGACPDDVTSNGTALQGPERTRNEQISSTKALAKLYMHKAK